MMEQSTITEHDCNVLGGLFQIIINDLKVCHVYLEMTIFFKNVNDIFHSYLVYFMFIM